jgi:hypothetical protein
MQQPKSSSFLHLNDEQEEEDARPHAKETTSKNKNASPNSRGNG